MKTKTKKNVENEMKLGLFIWVSSSMIYKRDSTQNDPKPYGNHVKIRQLKQPNVLWASATYVCRTSMNDG